MGCQKCIFFSAPTQIMVPWYTVEPPTNGLCPKHCTCAVNIIDHDVQNCLEDYYESHVLRITDQAERTRATKKDLLDYASDSSSERGFTCIPQYYPQKST